MSSVPRAWVQKATDVDSAESQSLSREGGSGGQEGSRCPSAARAQASRGDRGEARGRGYWPCLLQRCGKHDIEK